MRSSGGALTSGSGADQPSVADDTADEVAGQEQPALLPRLTALFDEEGPLRQGLPDIDLEGKITEASEALTATLHDNGPDAERATQQPAVDLPEALTRLTAVGAQQQSSGDTGLPRLLTTADTPTSTPILDTVEQLWTAALDTLPANVSDVPEPVAKAWACTCEVANQVAPVVQEVSTSIADLLAPILEGTGPDVPIDSPLLWAVMDWVRRQVDQVRTDPTIVEIEQTFRTLSVLTTQKLLMACAEPSQGLPTELERTVIASGLSEPVDFRFLPDDPENPDDGGILVAEKGGAIKLVKEGQETVTLVTLQTQTDFESGIGGIEVDPAYDENHYVYVSYTANNNRDRLSRFTMEGDAEDILASEKVLLESEQPAGPIHHGGEISYRTEGGEDYLYWAKGDNSTSTNAQDLTNIHGKILRIHPDGSIPDDNPFVDTPGARPEIWAYGLRNPFRFTFTPDGQMLVGDVGGADWEELNVVTKGANYGWPNAEGACDDCGYVNPIYAYPHATQPAGSGSITSVMVYTGDTLPAEYQNKVFIADYTLGWIKVLEFDSDYTTLVSEETFDSQAGTAVKLIQGPDGNIYQLNVYPGELSRIAPSGGNRAPTAVITATPSNGYAPLDVDFSSEGSSDPDPGTNLTYQWDFGDGTTSTEANPTKTYATNGAYDVTLTVSDGDKTGHATQTVTVGSTAPDVQILSPVNESKYNAGDTISFSGTATDQDEELPDSAYKWTVVYHHADHIHPVEDNIVGKTGSVTIPRDPHNVADSWYEVTLTVTDSSGLSTSESAAVRPNLVNLTVNANDPEAQFTVDGKPQTGSFTEQAVVGVERVVSAPSPQTVDDGQLVFDSWSDGGAQTHTIVVPATDASYTVNYDKVPSAL